MIDADIEQRVADLTAERMRVHNLTQAYERLRRARNDLKLARTLVEDDALGARIANFVVNEIEPIMWQIETTIREGE